MTKKNATNHTEIDVGKDVGPSIRVFVNVQSVEKSYVS